MFVHACLNDGIGEPDETSSCACLGERYGHLVTAQLWRTCGALVPSARTVSAGPSFAHVSNDTGLMPTAHNHATSRLCITSSIDVCRRAQGSHWVIACKKNSYIPAVQHEDKLACMADGT